MYVLHFARDNILDAVHVRLIRQRRTRFEVKADWVGFDEVESSWELLAIMWDGASQFGKSELPKLGLDRAARSRLRKLYGITL